MAAEQGFSKRRRITERDAFEKAFRAKRAANPWFTVYARANECGYARLGLVVGKKVAPLAVDRNVIKRLVREAFRCDFPAQAGLDIVVHARRQIGKDNKPEGREALAKLFKAVQA